RFSRKGGMVEVSYHSPFRPRLLLLRFEMFHSQVYRNLWLALETAAVLTLSGQRFRYTWEWNISHLQRGTFGVNGVRWLVGPIPRLQIELETAGTLLSLNPTESGRWSPRPFRTRVSYPAPAYRPVRRSVHSL